MNIVVVTRALDAHLLRWFLASYECFWNSRDKLVLFTRKSDDYLWRDIELPAGTRLIYREDFPELGSDDFRNQLYLKLIAHRFVDSEYYIVMDSDFLFVAPCREEVLLYRGKPIWFRRAWNQISRRWKPGSEIFAGVEIPHLYMSAPQYVFSRTIAAELERRYDLKQVLQLPGISEYILYGWFADKFFPDIYHWIDLGEDDVTPLNPIEPCPVGQKVNQVPPSYCTLDDRVSLDDFCGARYLAFWSHWDLAESKMAEFLVEAHRRHPERPLKLPKPGRIYPLVTLPAQPEIFYSEIRGLFTDGWVKSEVWFALRGIPFATQLAINVSVPAHSVTGIWQVDSARQHAFSINAGVEELILSLSPDEEIHRVLLRFDVPQAGVVDASGRPLIARFLNLVARS